MFERHVDVARLDLVNLFETFLAYEVMLDIYVST